MVLTGPTGRWVLSWCTFIRGVNIPQGGPFSGYEPRISSLCTKIQPANEGGKLPHRDKDTSHDYILDKKQILDFSREELNFLPRTNCFRLRLLSHNTEIEARKKAQIITKKGSNACNHSAISNRTVASRFDVQPSQFLLSGSCADG